MTPRKRPSKIGAGDALHEVTFPAGMMLDAAPQSMTDAGPEFRTLVRKGGDVTGYVFDPGLHPGGPTDQATFK